MESSRVPYVYVNYGIALPMDSTSLFAHLARQLTGGFEGIMTDAMFMPSACWRIYSESIEALGRHATPEAPRVDFENCEVTLRAIWLEALPTFVRELDDTLQAVTLTGRFLGLQT